MRKIFLVTIIIIFIVLFVIGMKINNYKTSIKQINIFNSEYEYYNNKLIYGTDIATLINKAINNNEKHSITKDKEGFYIDDNLFCIGIEIKFLGIEKYYKMESMQKADVNNFIKGFNSAEFKCIELKYNSNNRVSKIVFEQIN